MSTARSTFIAILLCSSGVFQPSFNAIGTLKIIGQYPPEVLRQINDLLWRRPSCGFGLRQRGDQMPMTFGIAVTVALAMLCQRALAEETFVVTPQTVADEKAVFATVESAKIVPARARIGGTVVQLAVRQGDRVEQDQAVATVFDKKLTLQVNALDAQIAGLQAELTKAKADLGRAQELYSHGTASKVALDTAQTAFDVATESLKARNAERSMVEQQITEGTVLAPAAGRVLTVPVTTGTVVLAGEAVATVAEQNFVLRLRVPERHARFLQGGDQVRIDGEDLGSSGAKFGTIGLVYPQIEDGHVVADATVAGLSDYFVGERIRVWISAGQRTSVLVPASFILTRFGIDYARMRSHAGALIDVPLQRGRPLPRPEMPDALEILSGLKAGDVLVRP
jgi:RND family efflux transporter MFP subunit